MANRYAVASGNWSSTATWDGGTLPQAGDDVRANGKTVTIDQDINVASIRTDALAPAVGGGVFNNTVNNRNIIANIVAGTSTCLTISGLTNITGNINGGPANPSFGVSVTNTTINVIGNLTSGNNNNSAGVALNTNSTANITGNLNGSGAGDPTYSSSGAISRVGTGTTANITGNANAFTSYGVFGINTLTFNGICTGGIVNSAGIYSSGVTSGNIIAQGSATTGGGVGILATTTSTTTIAEAIYTDCAPTSGKVRFKNINPKVTVLKANGTSQQLVEAGASGDFPIEADVRSGISYASGSLTGTLAVPIPANVRKGVPTDNTVGTADLTAADFWNTLTSTLTTAGSVGKLVSDNLDASVSSRATQTSVDTANSNINNIPANVWDKATNTLTTAGSIGERLKTASTVQTTGDQLASYQV